MSEKKPRVTRVYIVTDRATDKPVALIETITEAAARKIHSDKTVDVKLATQKAMFDAAKAGIEIETATAAEEES